MTRKWCTWSNKSSYGIFSEKTAFTCTTAALGVYSVLTITKQFSDNFGARIGLAVFVGLASCILGILGLTITRQCYSINLVRLILKGLFFTVAVIAFKSGSNPCGQELSFFLLQIMSLSTRTSNDPSKFLEGKNIIDSLLWILTGVACLSSKFSDPTNYAGIALNCITPIVVLMLYLFQPKKHQMKFHIDVSPTVPSILITTPRAEAGLSSDKKKQTESSDPLSFLGPRPQSRNPLFVSSIPASRNLSRQARKQTKRASGLIWNYPIADGNLKKSSPLLLLGMFRGQLSLGGSKDIGESHRKITPLVLRRPSINSIGSDNEDQAYKG